MENVAGETCIFYDFLMTAGKSHELPTLLKEESCILFFYHSHSHNDISNVYLLVLSKATEHCIKHYDCNYDRKIRYKIGPLVEDFYS